MSKNIFDPNNVYKKIQNVLLEHEKQVFDMGGMEEIKVQIRPNAQVEPAKFIPDPMIPGGYIAHPTTIRAIRKDIFLAGEEFEELEKLYVCESCNREIDLQFWLFCPYCEAQIPKDVFDR